MTGTTVGDAKIVPHLGAMSAFAICLFRCNGSATPTCATLAASPRRPEHLAGTSGHATCVALVMTYSRMQTTLRSLGISASNYKVLKLLPLVYEAWSSGKMTQERELELVALAQKYFSIGEDGEQILRGWLRHRPEVSDLREGLAELLLLSHAPYESAFEVDELPGLLAYSKALARTGAVAMGEPAASLRGDDQAMAAIAQEFGVVDGASWGALVRELRETN